MVCKPDFQTTVGIGCQGDFASQRSGLKRVCPGADFRRVSIGFSHVSILLNTVESLVASQVDASPGHGWCRVEL